MVRTKVCVAAWPVLFVAVKCSVQVPVRPGAAVPWSRPVVGSKHAPAQVAPP